MKNILKLMIPCMAFALSFTSCNDTMDDKAVIDAQYESAFSTPTVAIASATAPAYNNLAVNATVGNANDVAEQGIQFSTTGTFTMEDCIPNDTVEASFTITVGDLEELSTYYVRAYAVGKNGKVVYTEAQSVTTPEAPPTPLDGTYTAKEYDYNSNTGEWALAGSYKVTIEFEAGSTDIVNITNIWDTDATVQGYYDESTHTITIEDFQVIYNHPSYGAVWLQHATGNAIEFEFNPRGGHIETSGMYAMCQLGYFAVFYLDMQHDE